MVWLGMLTSTPKAANFLAIEKPIAYITDC
jgi:hypothetical protein